MLIGLLEQSIVAMKEIYELEKVDYSKEINFLFEKIKMMFSEKNIKEFYKLLEKNIKEG